MSVTPTNRNASKLSSILEKSSDQILNEWTSEMSGSARRSDLMKDSELRQQCNRLIGLMKEGLEADGANFSGPGYGALREMLAESSQSRAQQGFRPSDTATFVFSLKKPLFTRIQAELKQDPDAMAAELWSATELLDSMGLHVMEVFAKSREDTVRRQQEEMLELSTPVVKLWDGILALPMIGTLDSARTQVVMESSVARNRSIQRAGRHH